MIVLYFIVGILLIGISLILKRKLSIAILSGIFIAFQAGFTIYMAINHGITEDIYFTYDAVGILFTLILSVLAITTYYHGLIYLKDEPQWNYTIYHIGLIGLIMCITGVYVANNLMVTWIFMEGTTLCIATLIYHKRTERALEATWKYVFICSTGVALAYVGILFISTVVKNQPTADMSYRSLLPLIAQGDPVYLKLAFIFILIGYSAKLEIFPLYTIGIDANYVAPAPASAFISTALVNAGFVALFRVYHLFSGSVIFLWMNHVLIVTGLISLFIAAVYMQRVKNFKRMFAYSTVEHMGLVLIALGMGPAGYVAAFLQVILHSFIKSSLYYQMEQAHKILNSYKIFKSGDYFKLYPSGAMVMLMGMIAIVAIPPSGLFLSEIMIFKSMFVNGYWFVFIVTVFFLCFVIYGMTSKVLQMIFATTNRDTNYTVCPQPIQNITQYVMLGSVFIFCFYQPEAILNLINEAVGFLPK